MFTGRGDSGSTDTVDRSRESKSSARIDVEGAIDESISFIGMALVKPKWSDIIADLQQCQEDLYLMGEDIGFQGKKKKLGEDRVQWIEERTRAYKEEIGKIRLFVIPGGSEEAATLHIARVVSRSAERRIVHLKEHMEISKSVLKYANRLSSLLFMMAVVSNKRLGITERLWDIGIIS